MNAPQAHRYILMPDRGFDSGVLTSDRLQALSGPLVKLRPGAKRLRAAQSAAAAPSLPGLVILDKVREGGPMLVEVDRAAEAAIAERLPEIKLVPVVSSAQMRAGPVVKQFAQGAAQKPGSGIGLTVVDARTGRGVAGATVLLFTDLAGEEGDDAVTDAEGRAHLRHVIPGARVERLYVFGPPGYWGHTTGHQRAGQRATVAIRPIDLASRDLVLRRLYGGAPCRTARTFGSR